MRNFHTEWLACLGPPTFDCKQTIAGNDVSWVRLFGADDGGKRSQSPTSQAGSLSLFYWQALGRP